jgi:hypothetical protein
MPITSQPGLDQPVNSDSDPPPLLSLPPPVFSKPGDEPASWFLAAIFGTGDKYKRLFEVMAVYPLRAVPFLAGE